MLPRIKPPQKYIYLDYAATTPVDPRVQKAMQPFLNELFANPSSLHTPGQRAATALANARSTIAGCISARPEEIIFTSGGTEGANLAIFGVARSLSRKTHFITSEIEHHAVLESFRQLEREGNQVTYVRVNGEGSVKIDELKKAVRRDTTLISIMHANNEIGTIEPIAEIGRWLRGLNIQRAAKGLSRIYLHTDACQTAGSLEIAVDRLGVDLLSVNGSKMYGPKGSGFLYVRNGIALAPILYGGGQERNMRSGTENVGVAVGLAAALSVSRKQINKEQARLSKLQYYLIKKLKTEISDILVNGPDIKASKILGREKSSLYPRRLPNNVNVTIPGAEGEAMLLYLDSYGVGVSTGSACSSVSGEPSHVLRAIGRSAAEAESSLRLALGRFTTKKEIDYVLKLLLPLVKELRKMKK